MGEIGAMVARLEQEGLDLEQLIDCELEAAGFLSLTARSTDSLSDRADAISGNQSELKTLLKSIEDQLRMVQTEENIPENLLDDKSFIDDNKEVKHIIVIEDDEDMEKGGLGCQASMEPRPSYVTKATTVLSTSSVSQTTTTTTTKLTTPTTSTADSTTVSPNKKTPFTPKGQVTKTIPILPKLITTSSKTMPKGPGTPEGVIAYRTLKSPVDAGPATVSMVTLKSSQPVIPPQHVRGVITSPTTPIAPQSVVSMTSPTTPVPTQQVRTTPTLPIPSTQVRGAAMPTTSVPPPPQHVRGATTPTTPSASTIAATSVTQTPSSTQAAATVVNEVTTPVPIRPSPPKFEETTRIIGKRVDDLWYPGEIVKIISDRFNQVKFRVKFDQGNRGLLRTNQIALESYPPKFILDIGSRVVALRPRETADESASWRQAKEGPYGKLDVLYAGIVAEKSCPQTKHRFLIFFDDGFAQYLPLQKLHHVYHTGDKVWNEVAEHSQEFIQEYLEEFPNRPMVVLKTHQWVKTEWRGKWLKARVLEVDCSLVKMLFQVDNRTEWIYRGSTRLEPLYKALVHGKISRKKNKRQRKPPIDSQEPYVDFNATGPEFGFSLYSKTNTKDQQAPPPPSQQPPQPPQQERETKSSQSVAQEQGQPKESKSLSTSVATTTMQGQSTSTTTQLNTSTTTQLNTSTPTNAIIQTQPTITTTTNNTTRTSTPSGTSQAQPFTKQATLRTATSQTSSTLLMGTTSSTPLMGSTSSTPLMGSTAKSIANFNTLRRLATRLNKNIAMSNASSSAGSMSPSSTTITGSMSPSSSTTITGSMPISGGTSAGSVPTSSSTSTRSVPTSNTRSMSTTTTTITGSMPTTSSISMGSTSGSTSTGSMSTTITTITGSMPTTITTSTGSIPTTITTITGSMPTTSSISMGSMSTSGSTSKGGMPTSGSTSAGSVPTSSTTSTGSMSSITTSTGSMSTSITTSTGRVPTSITASTGSVSSITTSTGSMPTSITASTGCVPSVGERNSAAGQQTTNTVKILSASQTSLSSSSLGEQRNNGRIVSQSVPAITSSSSTRDSIINTNWSTSKYDGSTVSHFSQIHHLDTASIIKASTMRKRTTAGLAPNKSHVRMLDMNSDSALVFPGVSNGDIQTVRSSPIKMWDAPWKRNNHTNKISLKDQGLKIKVDLKHDPAALIQEHLQAQKKLVRTLKVMPELQPLIPKPPVLGPHKCGRQCGQKQQVNKKEKSKHNVFALPLLVNWKREITQRHPRSKKEIYYRAPCNKRLRSIEDVGKYLTLVGTTNVAIDQFSFDSEITCSDVLISSDNILLADISYGEESISISVANEHDSSLPPPIDYVSDRVLSDGVQINTDPGFLACCDCTDNCQDKTKCSCAQLTISASAAVDGKVDNTVGYEYRRLMDCVPTGIYECNQNCACSLQCFNRVVQNGIQLRLQVFKTENRGWGLRTLDDIPMGTFICTYSGQIMNEDMANKEGRDYGDEYLAELDHMEVVEKIKEGYESSVSDLEDDSVLLKTLETGHSTTDFSDNGSIAGSNISDSESSDSDSSHSSDSYIPRKKDRKLTRKSSFDDTIKITEEDGTSFSVTMADAKCVMATSSGKSIVLRRISASGDVTVEEEQTVVQQEKTQPVDAPPQKDLPPMSQPTIIDLTSDDEDSLMTNCASDKASDQTFDSSKNVDSKLTLSNDTNNLSTANELGKTDITVKHSAPGSNFQPFTDFKLIEISSSDADVTDDGSRDNSDVTGGSHGNSDAIPDLEKNASKSDNCINNASKDDSEQSVKERTSEGKIEEDEKGDCEQNDSMELESAVQSIVLQDRAASPMEINGDASSTTPNQVTSSVTEVTKQETMDTDPCLREQPQKPNDEMNNSSNIIRNEISCQGESCHGNQNSSHSNINNSQGGNSHGNEESSPSDINHSNESSSQGDGCPDNKDNSSDNNELDDDKHHHSSDSGQQQDVSKCNGDETSSHSNDKTSDVMGSSHGDKSDVTDESDYSNSKNSDIVDSCHGDTNDDVDGFHSDTRNIDSKDSAKDEMMDNYESSGGHHVDFELRMEIDDETEFLEENEPDDQDDRLSNTSISSTKNQPSEVSSDGVPPLMSADDLSRLAAQIHQADEEPPKLTKMQSGSRVTADLHDTIAKLQSRGVALDSISPEKNEDTTQSFEDLPLFPSTNDCDVDSFPPSPASSHSDSSVSDSLERSSDESYERSKRRERRVNDGRRARRFIVTLQKSGVKRSASPDGMEGGPYKRPSTRCLFDGEEHCYVIDAKAYGNCGRYLNHSCSPNLFVQNVFIDTHDLRFPRVAFFAQHNISAGSELTWDYMYEVGSVQDKVLRCYCGSSQCRGRLL